MDKYFFTLWEEKDDKDNSILIANNFDNENKKYELFQFGKSKKVFSLNATSFYINKFYKKIKDFNSEIKRKMIIG